MIHAFIYTCPGTLTTKTCFFRFSHGLGHRKTGKRRTETTAAKHKQAIRLFMPVLEQQVRPKTARCGRDWGDGGPAPGEERVSFAWIFVLWYSKWKNYNYDCLKYSRTLVARTRSPVSNTRDCSNSFAGPGNFPIHLMLKYTSGSNSDGSNSWTQSTVRRVFFHVKRYDDSNQIFLYMNQSHAWFKFIDDFTLGLPNWRA